MTASLLATILALGGAPEVAPESRALAYLARDVPRWATDNKCYSCHNNGDAARALYRAARLGNRIPAAALADTSRWLARPAGWDHNGGEGPFNDKQLARIQFAAALVEALDADLVRDRAALTRAAELVVEYQQADGSWKINGAHLIGSPATYGDALATQLARRTLATADARHFREAIARSDRWLRRVSVQTVLDAAAVFGALAKDEDDEAVAQRRRCLQIIRKGASKEGGWGPFVTAAPEPFDTAVVILALIERKRDDELRGFVQGGRRYLLATQQADGSWQETTRPPGAESYAQRISTTGWATLALLATRTPVE